MNHPQTVERSIFQLSAILQAILHNDTRTIENLTVYSAKLIMQVSLHNSTPYCPTNLFFKLIIQKHFRQRAFNNRRAVKYNHFELKNIMF